MTAEIYQKSIVRQVLDAFKIPKPLLQIISGPRQVGKTTAAEQIMNSWLGPIHYAAADEPIPPSAQWLEHQWDTMRTMRKKGNTPLLVLDEVQKIPGWSEVVKKQWDEDIRKSRQPSVVLTGSSSLLLQKGMTESLSGRFLLHRCYHWDAGEMSQCFNWDLRQWLFFGGYPGAAPLIGNELQWQSYIRDALIDTVLNKDIFQLENITKPALFRQLFMLSATHPAEILSFNKMLGQLQNAGNTTTLAHYLGIMNSAYLVTGLSHYKRGVRVKRGSSPKLIIRNNALVSAIASRSYKTAQAGNEWWGRLVENAVGAHILNQISGKPAELFYWRQNNLETDFILQYPDNLFAIEVKSGKMKRANGLRAFCKLYPEAKPVLIGSHGIPLETFFRGSIEESFQAA